MKNVNGVQELVYVTLGKAKTLTAVPASDCVIADKSLFCLTDEVLSSLRYCERGTSTSITRDMLMKVDHR